MNIDMDQRRTPLIENHLALHARVITFAGWEMPLQFSGIIEEVRAVRSAAGLFDVSHMGRVEISGPTASFLLNRVFSTDVAQLKVGRARYGVICNQEGGIIDDCIVYRLGSQRFMLVPNASNTSTVIEWLSRCEERDDEVSVEDTTPRQAMIALQGPTAAKMLGGLTELGLDKLRTFWATETAVSGVHTILARTGYTGEEGFELMIAVEDAPTVWELLIAAGATPCGLGARDVLRLEAGLLLHGNDMNTSINPYEAGLERFVDPDRDEYVAGEALRGIRESGWSRTLVGFNMIGRGIARHAHPIMSGTKRIGEVSSGSYSPTLDRNIGLGYVPTSCSALGTRFHVDVRGRSVEAEVTKLPFYSWKKGI